jgi:hypothetical protein
MREMMHRILDSNVVTACFAVHSFSKGFRYYSEEGLAREAATGFPAACLLPMTCHTTETCVYESKTLP